MRNISAGVMADVLSIIQKDMLVSRSFKAAVSVKNEPKEDTPKSEEAAQGGEAIEQQEMATFRPRQTVCSSQYDWASRLSELHCKIPALVIEASSRTSSMRILWSRSSKAKNCCMILTGMCLAAWMSEVSFSSSPTTSLLQISSLR